MQLHRLKSWSKREPVRQVIEQLVGCGTLEAEQLIDKAPYAVIARNLPQREAEAVRSQLQAAGAVAMLARPAGFFTRDR